MFFRYDQGKKLRVDGNFRTIKFINIRGFPGINWFLEKTYDKKILLKK